MQNSRMSPLKYYAFGQAHGGLTYASSSGEGFPKGYFWYGWDYAHSGDRCTYYEPKDDDSEYRNSEQKWTPEDVDNDSWTALYEFKDLMKLSEAIARKAKEIL